MNDCCWCCPGAKNHDGCGRCIQLWLCGSTCMWGRAMNVAFGDSCILQCLIGSLCMICKRKKLREKYNIEGGSGCRC